MRFLSIFWKIIFLLLLLVLFIGLRMANSDEKLENDVDDHDTGKN